MKDLILEVKNITKEVNSPEGTLTIVQDVNLSITEGDLVSLVGPSGSGKTTLLAIMAGLDLPSQGSVTLLGSEITSLDEDKRAQIRGQDVGFVFQSFHLMPKLSAIDNVMLPLEISGSDEAQTKAKEALHEQKQKQWAAAGNTTAKPRQAKPGQARSDKATQRQRQRKRRGKTCLSGLSLCIYLSIFPFLFLYFWT